MQRTRHTISQLSIRLSLMIPVKDILKTLRTIINESATEEDSFTIETDEALKEFIRLALLALMNDEGVMAEASEMTDSSSISFEKRPDGLFLPA